MVYCVTSMVSVIFRKTEQNHPPKRLGGCKNQVVRIRKILLFADNQIRQRRSNTDIAFGGEGPQLGFEGIVDR